MYEALEEEELGHFLWMALGKVRGPAVFVFSDLALPFQEFVSQREIISEEMGTTHLARSDSFRYFKELTILKPRLSNSVDSRSKLSPFEIVFNQ